MLGCDEWKLVTNYLELKVKIEIEEVMKGGELNGKQVTSN